MLVSIITPTIDEAANIPARALEIAQQPGPWEWVVADGGSADETVAIATAHGALVVSAVRGRGTQLNAGARRARGDILLFLHADTRLPPGALDAIRHAVSTRGVSGGNFAIRFDGEPLFAALLAAQAYLRQRLFRAYYGDSAIFARREAFEQIGGFPDQPLFEDWEFSRRLERHGTTERLPICVTASGRRFRGRRLRILLLWGALKLLYAAGVGPARLAAWYQRDRQRTEHRARHEGRSARGDHHGRFVPRRRSFNE